MGSLNAMGMAEAVKDGAASLDAVLVWHLQSNHFPPINLVFLPVVKEAIERADAEDWDHMIEMPNGVTLSVGEICDQLHLDAFIDLEPGDEDGD